MKEYSVVIAAFLSGVLGPLLVMYLRELLEKRKAKKTDMLADAIETSSMVEDKIEEIMKELKADRVWIAQFHNGAHYYPTGKSIAKFSIMYEANSLDVPSIQSRFQNVPVNLFGKALNHLSQSNCVHIGTKHNDEIVNYGIGYFFDEHHCKSTYICPIKNIDDKFVGFLGVDYVNEDQSLTQEEILHLELWSASIGGVITNHLEKC